MRIDGRNPQTFHFRVQRIDEVVPALGDEDTGYFQQQILPCSQPFIAGRSCSLDIVLPTLSKEWGFQPFNGHRTRGLNLQNLEVFRPVFSIDFQVNQGLKQRCGRIFTAIDNGVSLRVPSAGNIQAANSIQVGVVADPPKSEPFAHATKP